MRRRTDTSALPTINLPGLAQIQAICDWKYRIGLRGNVGRSEFSALIPIARAVCPSSYDPTNDQEDRQILMNVLMHSADLSNPVRPFPIAKKWG